jgi:hypothetical protein
LYNIINKLLKYYTIITINKLSPPENPPLEQQLTNNNLVLQTKIKQLQKENTTLSKKLDENRLQIEKEKKMLSKSTKKVLQKK